MSHGPEHHIEEAEHAAHASHDGFNRNVTMSIAIVAAVLACVTMLGHDAHNETLRLQGESLALHAQANITSTDAANKWAYYQVKNVFNRLAENSIDLLAVVAVRDDRKKEFDEIVKRNEGTVKKYSGDNSGANKGKLAEIEQEALEMTKERKELEKRAKEKMDESNLEHRRAARLDYGELFLQFGVVLCSLAILTRNRNFWFGGIGSSAIGAAVAVTGQFGLMMAGHH